MRVLVTGAAGFIGSKLCEELLNRGCEVFGIDDLSNGEIANIPKGVEFVLADISLGIPKAIPSKINVICHLAGQSSGEKSFSNPILDLRRNTVSTLTLIDWARKNGCERFLSASSMAVYGCQNSTVVNESAVASPKSYYGISKLSAEMYLRIQNEFDSCSLRMFNVYGPGQKMADLKQGMVSIFLAQALAGEEIVVRGSLSRVRDFIYIDDVVNTWASFAESGWGVGNAIINLGTGVPTDVSALIEILSTTLNKKITPVVEDATPGDIDCICADVSLLKRFVDTREFVSVGDGVKKFGDWALL